MKRNPIAKITVLIRSELQKDTLASKIANLPVDADHPIQVVISEQTSKRTLPQNNIMWGMLGDISAQVRWYEMKLTPDEWKDMFTASLKKQKTVPGIDGGFVVIGAHTSKMTVADMADLITLMTSFGVDKNVKFKSYME